MSERAATTENARRRQCATLRTGANSATFHHLSAVRPLCHARVVMGRRIVARRHQKLLHAVERIIRRIRNFRPKRSTTAGNHKNPLAWV
jgi:hypothetical protein